MAEIRKILVIQTASTGDVILSTPVVEKLHSIFPEASIDFLLKNGNEGLFKNHPFLNDILIWDKADGKYNNLLGIVRKVRKSRYDAVINLQRFGSSGLITMLSGAKFKAGFDKNPFSFSYTHKVKHTILKKNLHETERNILLIAPLTDSKPAPVKLYPSGEDYNKVESLKSEKYITIAPASLWFTKQYPTDRWIEFVKMVDNKIKIYFLGSARDIKICDEIINGSELKTGQNLAGKLTLLQTTALMKDATMNYVNDSAPLHLASAVNAPVTAVFCSTVSSFGFGPLSDDSKIIETRELLDCRPCGLHGFTSCPKGHFKCAYTINNKELINRIKL
ncbi:MAG: glycosyltransferase family 9 protein [Bacteroidales bacterium]|nr:glycosyltransferase family 9 protein [Bacteroidales bacterium]